MRLLGAHKLGQEREEEDRQLRIEDVDQDAGHDHLCRGAVRDALLDRERALVPQRAPGHVEEVVGEAVAYAKQIDLEIRSAGSAAELSPTITGCGDSLGEPPRRSSLQFRPGKLVLYLPRQCLLDPKVRAKRRGRDA
jgi:hypothetical protein